MMRDKIRKTLQEIEVKKNIKILCAVEAGTRGWGFPSKDSDYHCRFIYVHRQECYLSINEVKDNIEISVDSIYDIQGWDLKKVLISIQDSNPTVLEWLQSPITYMEKEGFKETLLEISSEYFSEKAALRHYKNIAVEKLEDIKKHKEERLKRYFYVLRSLLATDYIMKNHSMPPMAFDSLYKSAAMQQDLCDEIDKLVKIKTDNNDWHKVPSHELLIKCFEDLLAECDAYLINIQKKEKPDSEALNKFFRDWIK